jgi:2-polyprenyl-6-methoxyphenol hydroxylase-like FAD-dependent oxidoreductase
MSEPCERGDQDLPTGAAESLVDVLIIGGGLAGLCLARQLLLAQPERSERILLVDRRELPPRKQKVGEATVQVSGYYFARVLEMEEHLLREHYLKYNLRFYWKNGARGERYEELSQSYLRDLSNIFTYQLDRNVLEAELLRVNLQSPRFTLHAPVTELKVELRQQGGPHAFSFRAGGPGSRQIAGRASWVVDASGRGKILAKRLGLQAASPIRHGATFCWVEGLVDIEKLTDLTPRQVRLRRDRSVLGHSPVFLATNHLCGEGYWFWLIPLHGKTSLGLVYDRERVPREEVATPQKLIEWVCRQYPLLARDLPRRKVLDFAGFTDFAYDCTRTLDVAGWALCGEACRFSDPLYSPGGDLIAVYNTLIADAILTEDGRELAAKVPLYEATARSLYEAYVPSYAVSYDTLGDQETFSLRYTWELAVYFSFFVFPFINDLFTDRRFLPGYLRRLARLGPTNRNLHELLVDYYRWKQSRARQAVPAHPAAAAAPGPAADAGPCFFDFAEIEQLREARSCFYRVGLSGEEARKVVDEQLANLEQLARAIAAHVTAAVTGDRRALAPAFAAAIDLRHLRFDPVAMAERVTTLPAPPRGARMAGGSPRETAPAAISHARSSRGDANGPGSKAREGRTTEAYSKYVERVRPSGTQEKGPFPAPQQRECEKWRLDQEPGPPYAQPAFERLRRASAPPAAGPARDIVAQPAALAATPAPAAAAAAAKSFKRRTPKRTSKRTSKLTPKRTAKPTSKRTAKRAARPAGVAGGAR